MPGGWAGIRFSPERPPTGFYTYLNVTAPGGLFLLLAQAAVDSGA